MRLISRAAAAALGTTLNCAFSPSRVLPRTNLLLLPTRAPPAAACRWRMPCRVGLAQAHRDHRRDDRASRRLYHLQTLRGCGSNIWLARGHGRSPPFRECLLHDLAASRGSESKPLRTDLSAEPSPSAGGVCNTLRYLCAEPIHPVPCVTVKIRSIAIPRRTAASHRVAPVLQQVMGDQSSPDTPANMHCTATTRTTGVSNPAACADEPMTEPIGPP